MDDPAAPTRLRSLLRSLAAIVCAVGVQLISAAWASSSRLGMLEHYLSLGDGDRTAGVPFAQDMFGNVFHTMLFLALAALSAGVVVVWTRRVWPAVVSGLLAAVPYAVLSLVEASVVRSSPVLMDGVMGSALHSDAAYILEAVITIVPAGAIGIFGGFLVLRRSYRSRAGDATKARIGAMIEQEEAARLESERAHVEAAAGAGPSAPDTAEAEGPPIVPGRGRVAARCPRCGAANASFRATCILCGAQMA